MARVMTLNVAHAAVGPIPPFLRRRAGIERRLDAIGAAIARERPDVVALQEVDRPTFFSKRVDGFGRIAGALALHGLHAADRVDASVHPRPGTALLARAPLAEPRAHAFKAWLLDDKSFTAGVMECDGVAIDVVSVHLDPISGAARRAQIAQMAAALGARTRPRVVMGDCNATFRGDVALLARALDVAPHEPDAARPTFPAWRPIARLDWILASPDLAFTAYRTLDAVVSDHRGVVAEITPR